MGATDIEETIPSVSADVEETKRALPLGRVDAALEFLQAQGMVDMSAIDEKKLVQKIDWMIIPLLWACYMLQYLDKVLINYASVMGLLSDTHMDTNQFSSLAVAFYITYLAFELPTGYLMQRLPTAKYLGFNVAIWGLMTALNCTTKNFGGLVALRVLLGCFESAVAPALILITSMWYKRNEQPQRMGFWYLGTGTAMIIGALLAYGLLFYTADTFRSWQLMFLICGLITVAVGICVIVFLPDNPMSSRLNHDEKIWAIERLRENKTGIENKHFKMEQFVEVFKDPQTYLFIVIVTAMNIPNGAISNFSAQIIKSFGFTTKQTELLNIPAGAVHVIAVLSSTYMASRFDQRCLCLIVTLMGGLLGGCLLAFSHGQASRLAGNYLTNLVGASLPLMYSVAGANIAGHTKKVTMNAIMIMCVGLGNILGPLTFRTKDAPNYIPAKIAIVATVSVAITFIAVLMLYYTYENRQRDRNHEGEVHQENSEFLDLTDRQNREFRYKY